MDTYQQYRERYASLERIVIYEFRRGYGGIGDLLKFFIYALQFCMKNNVRLYYGTNNLLIDKYLRLVDDRMYLRMDVPLMPIKEIKEDDFPHLVPEVYHVVTPFVFYNTIQFEYLKIPIGEVFTVSDEVKQNAERVLPGILGTSYISVHVRLGDKYLETDPSFIACPNDVREFDEGRLFAHLESKLKETRVVFVCDNQGLKNRVRQLFPTILTPNTIIGHTDLENTSEQQVLDAISEFYIVAHGQEVHVTSQSGFPRVAAAFRGIPVVKIQ